MLNYGDFDNIIVFDRLNGWKMTKNQIKLFIVDNDPIFRLGFCTAIAQYPDFLIIGQGDTSNDTWRQLSQGLILNILVIGVGLDSAETEFSSLEFCQQLSQVYPELPLFVLSLNLKSRQLATIKSWQVRGHCQKGTDIETIINGLRSVAYGESYWQNTSSSPSLLQNTLARVSRSGRQQLYESIAEINQKLAQEDLSDWERVWLIGRKRELLAARWVASRLTAEEIDSKQAESNEPNALGIPPEQAITPYLPPTELAIAPVFDDPVTAKIFNRVVADIQLGLVNRTNIALEIDILQPQKKQELLFLILDRLSKTLTELRLRKSEALTVEFSLRNIWQQTTIDFFFDNYDRAIEMPTDQFSQFLLQEYPTIETIIFSQIYAAAELFSYLLGEKALIIDNIKYRSESPESIARAENLLHNLIIQIANAVMQVILNNFYDLEIFKYNLYIPEYRSTREIARFRNELSWRYRQELYWDNPKNIFESSYRLLVLHNGKIKTLLIYAPRVEELRLLKGLPWLTTIVIEIRDAIAPRLRSVLSFAGNGVVFVLTQVIGRAIGLIGKGIIQGIGSAMKDKS